MFDEYLKNLRILNENKLEFEKYSKSFSKFNKLIFIGNGGSNAIASHIAQDAAKFYGKKSLSFSDSSMITCFNNDFGVENAFQKFLEIYADKQTLNIFISSSGESENIINCINFSEKNNLYYGILTGFKKNNTARKKAKNHLFDFHVDSSNYGVIECIHQIFLHGVI